MRCLLGEGEKLEFVENHFVIPVSGCSIYISMKAIEYNNVSIFVYTRTDELTHFKGPSTFQSL